MRARKARSDASMKRLLDEMAESARAQNAELQRGCVDPVLHRDTLQAAAVMGLELPRPLHVADYLSPLDARAAGLGEVCRVCGNAKPTSVVVDMTETSAAAAIAQAGPLLALGAVDDPKEER